MILFVDDDPCYLRVIKHMLKFRDTELVTQKKIPEAISWFTEHDQCKLILLDLHMRDGQGVDLLNWLNEHRPTIPLVILCDTNRDNFKNISTDHGKPTLAVPFNGEELLQCVTKHYAGTI
jgi:CheY-like chemotaxis protein